MSNTLKIGVLGLTHDHVWDNLVHLAKCPEATLVAASDPNAPLTARVAREYGCRIYGSHAELLEKEPLDAVYIFSSNAEGAELALAALQRKLHVLIEKPMAARLEQADRMLRAAAAADAKLVVNWPFAWWPQLQHALTMAQSGAIGKLWGVKYRAAHAGPRELGCSDYFCSWLFDAKLNGAGAMMDYCCYGCLLATSLLGMPESVSGMMGGQVKDSIQVEDNALIAMKYAFGLSTAEGSWTQIGKLTSYTTALYGTQGTLLVEPRLGGRLLLANREDPTGSEVPVPEPAAWMRDSASHFVAVIRGQQEPLTLCRAQFARDAQEILEAGLRSAQSGAHVRLPLA